MSAAQNAPVAATAPGAANAAGATPAATPAASGGFLSGLTSLFATKPTVPCKCPTCGNEHTRPAPAAQAGGRRSRRNRKNSRKNRKNNRKD